ncbi:hypothetical protein Dimus_028782 [Dionaea muscipula]
MSKNVSFSSGSSSSTCPLLQPVRRFVPSSMNKAGDSTIEAMITIIWFHLFSSQIICWSCSPFGNHLCPIVVEYASFSHWSGLSRNMVCRMPSLNHFLFQ